MPKSAIWDGYTGDILLVTVTSCHIGAMLADGVTSTFFSISYQNSN